MSLISHKAFAIFIIVVIFPLFTGLSQSSIVPPTMAFEPANPFVGQEVIFTINLGTEDCYTQKSINEETNMYPEGKSNSGILATFTGSVVTSTSSSLRIISPATFTHVYTSSGTYTVDFDCADNNNTVTSSKDFTKNLVSSSFANQVTVSAAPAIPTIAQWGIITLALSLLIVGIVTIVSKRSQKINL